MDAIASLWITVPDSGVSMLALLLEARPALWHGAREAATRMGAICRLEWVRSVEGVDQLELDGPAAMKALFGRDDCEPLAPMRIVRH
jgi:hypothetical protein